MTPAEDLVGRLGGRWHGSYGVARCPAHDDGSPSLSIRDGERAVLLKCHAGCDQRDILLALRGKRLSPREVGFERGKPFRPRRSEKDRHYLISIWRACRPINGTAAEHYLRNRGIEKELPASLSFHPALKHTDTGLLLPAMVAAVQAPDRTIFGLHRTFLCFDGRDKASVSHPRKMLGQVTTGAVRLAAAGPEIAVGEGIETCLSFMQATGLPTWAALSANGLSAIVLPPLPVAATVHVLVDLDPAGERASLFAANRFHREGRKVKLERPLAGKDVNDALRGVACVSR